MGLLTKGQINVSVLTLQAGTSLVALAENAKHYETTAQASTGWGQLSDEPSLALKGSLLNRFVSKVPSVTKNHHGTETLAMRLYYELPNLTLRRAFGEQADRKQFWQRYGVDVLILKQNDSAPFTVLVASSNAAEIKGHVKPALEALVPEGAGTGMVNDFANTDELDPDLFLWLFYKDAHGRNLTPTLKLSEIARMESRNGPIWRSRFYRGASVDRIEIMTLIAKGNTIFGPAKFSFMHSGDPRGDFEIRLNNDLSFSVLRTSEYLSDELKSLPPEEAGPRMTLDMWQVFIPAIRRAHLDDQAWNPTGRTKFVDDCRKAVHKV